MLNIHVLKIHELMEGRDNIISNEAATNIDSTFSSETYLA